MQTIVTRIAVIAWVGLSCFAAQAQDDSERELSAEDQQALEEMRPSGVARPAHRSHPARRRPRQARRTRRLLPRHRGHGARARRPGQPARARQHRHAVPARSTRRSTRAWAVTIGYEDDGHVSDSDASGIDYTQLLNEMRSDIRAGNSERESDGYPPIELVGWAEPPLRRFEPQALLGEGAAFRGFGRLDAQLRDPCTRPHRCPQHDVHRGHRAARRDQPPARIRARHGRFNPGNRYEDFDSNIDEVAAYGIGALIAGKVAAKAGLLAGGLLLSRSSACSWCSRSRRGRKIKACSRALRAPLTDSRSRRPNALGSVTRTNRTPKTAPHRCASWLIRPLCWRPAQYS